MEMTTACPERAETAWSSASTSTAAVASSPDVGSSSTRSGGECNSSSAMERRLRSPPEMPRFRPMAPGSPMRVFATACSPSCTIRASRRSSDRGSFAETERREPRSVAPSRSVSRTVSVPKRRSVCGTKPTLALVAVP